MGKMKKNPRISVIMPAYNASLFLRRSIESVLNQSYSDLELIIVDDGSTDDTGKIINEYKILDKRIIAVYQENQGPSVARNAGIRKSRGEFVAFVDADDYLEIDAYDKMISAIDSLSCDCAMSSFSYVYSNGRKNKEENRLVPGIYNYSKILECLVKPFFQDRLSKDLMMGSVCRFLFKRQIILDNNIYFTLNYLEDELFLLKYFSNETKLVYINESLYNYFQNSDSIIHSYHKNLDLDLLKYLDIKQKVAKKYNFTLEDDWFYNSCWAIILILVSNEFAPGNNTSFLEKIKRLKEICSIPNFKNAISLYKPKKMIRNKTVVAFLIRKKLYYILSLLYVLKNRK